MFLNRHLLELFNESMTVVLCYHHMLFTDLVQHSNSKDFYGFISIIIICVVIVVNILFIFYQSFHGMMYKRMLFAKRARWLKFVELRNQTISLNELSAKSEFFSALQPIDPDTIKPKLCK